MTRREIIKKIVRLLRTAEPEILRAVYGLLKQRQSKARERYGSGVSCCPSPSARAVISR